jgi:cysteine-rich repeat protein
MHHTALAAIAAFALIDCYNSTNILDRDSGDAEDATTPLPDAGGSVDPRDAGSAPDVLTYDGGPGSCGMFEPSEVITGSTPGILLDTRSTTNRLSVSGACGSDVPIGNDAFIAVDAQPGQIWHFHLSTLTPDVDPYLVITDGTCSPVDCVYSPNNCVGSGDEHAGIQFERAGRFYVGADSVTAGGGQFTLGAALNVCSDGVRSHGEACDDGNTFDGDGCNRRCMYEIGPEIGPMLSEHEPNDNRFEANHIVLDAAGERTVQGLLTPTSSCFEADYFEVDVPASERVIVEMLEPGGAPCASGALTSGYTLELQNAAGEVVVAGQTDTNGCAIVQPDVLTGGRYFIRIASREVEGAIIYRLHVRVAP